MPTTTCLDYPLNNLVCVCGVSGDGQGREIKQYRDFVVSVTVIGLVEHLHDYYD